MRVGARRPEQDVARIGAVRHAVGDGVRLMVDCNERLDLPSAIWLARQLQEFGVFWMEEPLLSDDIVGHARLAAATGMTLAVGEHLQGRFDFAADLQQAAASVCNRTSRSPAGSQSGLASRTLPTFTAPY